MGLATQNVKKVDIFVCYLTKVSRWCGVLQADSPARKDDSPLHEDLDIFKVRFDVNPLVVLDPEESVPIYDDRVWKELSITKNYEQGTSTWTGFFRASLNRIDDKDGQFLVELLEQQQSAKEKFPFTERDKRQLSAKSRLRTVDRVVEVEIPEEDDIGPPPEASPEDTPKLADERVSIQYQAKVAEIGAKMGFRIWIPRNDRARVLEHVPASQHGIFLDSLPLNYDDATLRTIEQIDVLWLKGRAMARAFEIEHTTAIYSGLLRMADLLALQPNMNIRLHIVAPIDKRERVLREIRRPVFSLLDRGPLYEQCSYLSYDSIDALSGTQHLTHMSDSILAEYEESTEI